MTKSDADILGQLQAWYFDRCDGEWEHLHVISIGTIDNPGWKIYIDFADTYLAGRIFEDVQVKGSETGSWYDCKIRGCVFEAFCDPNGLSTVLSIFLQWAMQPTSEKSGSE